MHRYTKRPAYKSVTEELIELHPQKADEAFIESVLQALAPIGAKTSIAFDAWMNDEIWINCSSSDGEFLLTCDIWDLSFISSKSNQPLLHKIDSILDANSNFERFSSDYSLYR